LRKEPVPGAHVCHIIVDPTFQKKKKDATITNSNRSEMQIQYQFFPEQKNRRQEKKLEQTHTLKLGCLNVPVPGTHVCHIIVDPTFHKKKKQATITNSNRSKMQIQYKFSPKKKPNVRKKI